MPAATARSWSVRIISRPVRSPTWARRGCECPPNGRWRIRPSRVRSKTAPQASSSRTRSGASWAWSWAIRGLLSSLPPTIVSRKWTCQESCSATLPSAAATPPSAITVWALPRSDLQTSPTFAPWRRRLDRRPQAGSPGPDHQDVVGVALGDLVHSRIDGSLNSPIARSRMYRSASATASEARPGPAHVVDVEIGQPLPQPCAASAPGRCTRSSRAVRRRSGGASGTTARSRSAGPGRRTGSRCPGPAAKRRPGGGPGSRRATGRTAG